MKNNRTRHAPLILAVIALVGVIAVLWQSGNKNNITSTVASSDTEATENNTSNKNTENIATVATSDKDDGMLAVWVPYMSLSVENDPSEENFKATFNNIVKVAKAHNINALIVHVRPYADSMYLSDYFPFSHILTGTQGENPGYDAMEYMVNTAHENDLEFHAWINPLRVKVNDTPPELSEYSPYILWQNDDNEENDRFTMEYDGNIYFNPAYEEVREYIIKSVREIVSRYNVDGVQFDDYFYPDSSTEYDSQEYNSYLSAIDDQENALSQLEWRKANINTLISGVYSGIKSENSDVMFGISPQGNIENDLKIGADVYEWGSTQGYCDYLCPQIYFSESNNILPYDEAVDEWSKVVKNENVKLYIGLGLYKAGSDDDDGTWLDSDENIKSQIEYGRSKEVDGFMFYSFDYLDNEQTKTEVENVMKYLNGQT